MQSIDPLQIWFLILNVFKKGFPKMCLREAKLITAEYLPQRLDESTWANRKAIEALDTTLQDLRNTNL